ncbi:sigma-70 family RNA polymerase sigma factor [Pedobacter endophyticus]|uniref:Sigma-70 family RNA polymerase sigma factor n=1 Tax=Pedobacter endophyticus TaxID=2789740 RepID=A0A7S9KZ71_9SPHI|nr:sigma-70 family RNA polymerase sigma factor [Pedobacter endophyticus]QPH39552.1 sigma-70 family RNA polymerase sigma factor [Pedobacter endophyticus]
MNEDKTVTAEIVDGQKLSPITWVEKYADYLYHFAMMRLRDEEVARDLVQDTFLAALQQLSKFEGRSNEKTWLTAIIKNKIADFYRKQSSKKLRELGNAENEQRDFFESDSGHWNTSHEPQAFGLDAENPLLVKELGLILDDCLKKLPALWFSVFSMKHIDDLASAKICATLNLSDSNFWVIMHRTKLNLRACLQKHWN